MTVHVTVEQLDGRRFAVRARELELIIDDTLENGGPGDGFRPTELLLGGLGACMMGTMINFARNQEIPIRGVSMELDDTEFPHPERIGRITIKMEVTAEATERQIASLQRVAAACKIHNTLEREPEFDFDFHVVAPTA
jgi:uncharacterized OsmC-like protein